MLFYYLITYNVISKYLYLEGTAILSKKINVFSWSNEKLGNLSDKLLIIVSTSKEAEKSSI